MKRSVILLTALLFTGPALADNSGSMMSGGSMNHMSAGHDCQSMMNEAKPKLDAMADSAMKTKAMQEMSMAHSAMDKGQTKSCMSHMHKAMGMMK
jgi:hypothetical protein